MEANNKQVHVDSIDEEIVARVAGIDVAKDSGMVCTRVPHQSQPGKRTTTVWSVSARTNSIIELADRLAGGARRAGRARGHLGLLAPVLLPPGKRGAWWCGWSTPAT